MSVIKLNLKKENNLPVLNIKIQKDEFFKDTVIKKQIKNNLGDVFLSDIQKEKINISLVNGIVIKRILSTNNINFVNSFIVDLEENDNKELEFNFIDDSNVIRYNIPSIQSLTQENNANVMYQISFFNFPSALTGFNDIKLEETLIYKYYNNFNENISSAKIKNIVSQIKSSKNLQNIDKEFFNIYTVNTATTNTLKLKKSAVNNLDIVTRLLYDNEFVLYSIDLNNEFVGRYDYDISKIDIFTIKKEKNFNLKSKSFKVKEIKYSTENNKIYFNILSKEQYDFFTGNYKTLRINLNLNVYNKNSNVIISKKSDTFTL